MLHEGSGRERWPGKLSQSAVYTAGGSQATSKQRPEPGRRADLKYTAVPFERAAQAPTALPAAGS